MSHSFLKNLLRLRHKKRSLIAGELIFERDDPVRSYYSVESGEVHLLRRHIDGREVILQRAKAGAVLAEASFNSQLYHCSAVAVEDSVLAVFLRADVRTMLDSDTEAMQAFALHLSREVQNARRRAEIISLRLVSDRVDAWLIWHDHVLPKKGSWHRLADEIGVSKEALYRELAHRR